MVFQMSITWRGRTTPVYVDAVDPTLGQLGKAIEVTTGASFETLKLLVPGRKGQISPSVIPEQLASEAGLLSGCKALLLASRADEVSQVRASRDLPAMRGFDDELKRAARRRRTAATLEPPKAEFSFEAYESWQRPGLHPPPSEALKLLYRLANDPGILGVMAAHRYRVGLLSEMPPEGKVGISPVCILGVNINQGQEITLRLRTDDLKGFRKYERIRETLIHELAHMEYGDHDNNFKQLNSQLGRECAAINARYSSGHSLLDSVDPFGPHDGRPQSSELDTVTLYDEDDVMAATARLSGKTLRQLAGPPHAPPGVALGASEAAAAAAPRGPAGSALTASAAAAARALAASAALLRSQQQQQGMSRLPAEEAGMGVAAARTRGWLHTGEQVAGPLPEAPQTGGDGAAAIGHDSSGSSSGGGSSDEHEGRGAVGEFEHYDKATEAAEVAARRLGSLEGELAGGVGDSVNGGSDGGTAEPSPAPVAGAAATAVTAVAAGQAAAVAVSLSGVAQLPDQGASEDQEMTSAAPAASDCGGRGEAGAALVGGSSTGAKSETVSASSAMEVDGGGTVPTSQQLPAAPAPPKPPLRLVIQPPADVVLPGSDGGVHTTAAAPSPPPPAAAVDGTDAVVQDKLRQAWGALARLVAAANGTESHHASGPQQLAAGSASRLAAAGGEAFGGGGAQASQATATVGDVVAALDTLETLLGNAAQLPGEERYRRVRLGNGAFQRRVGRLPGGVELLRVAGFTAEGSGEEAVLRLRRNDPGLLWLVLSVVREAREQVAAQVAAAGGDAGSAVEGGQ